MSREHRASSDRRARVASRSNIIRLIIPGDVPVASTFFEGGLTVEICIPQTGFVECSAVVRYTKVDLTAIVAQLGLAAPPNVVDGAPASLKIQVTW